MSILIHAEAIIPNLPLSVTINSVDWEFATDAAFANIIHQSLADAVNLKTYTRIIDDATLAGATVVYVRTRLNTSIGATDYSLGSPCSDGDISTPQISITGFPNSVPGNPILSITGQTFNNGYTFSYVDWYITDINGRVVWSLEGDTSGVMSTQVPPNILKGANDYTALASITATDGTNTKSSPLGIRNFRVEGAVITTPVVSVAGTPLVANSGAFTTTPANADIHVATNWELRDSTGASVWHEYNSTGNKTSLVLPPTLTTGNHYVLEVQYVGSNSSSDKAMYAFVA